jgi:hypothetical protein
MAVNVVTEEVANNLEEIAQATRRINTKSVGLLLSGATMGLVVGLYFGYKYNKEKIRAEAFKESEEEVARIRDHYQQKVVASEPKPPVEVLIEEKGYDRPLKAPVPIIESEIVRADTLKDDDEKVVWNYERELEHRLANPDDPYVIHQEEFMNDDTGYEQVVYTYYERDDVLVGDDEEHPLPHADIIVGQNNLQFGHGTDDPDVVYVRNNDRKLEMEIVRVHKSFEEEILGIENSEEPDDDDD